MFEEGEPEAGERFEERGCRKDFIPVKEFTMDHLKHQLELEELYISLSRPDTYPDSTVPYHYAEYKAPQYEGVKRTGNGFILPSSKSSWVTHTKCPCPNCKHQESEQAKKEYFSVIVLTAAHVVFDDSGAGKSVCKLFEDTDRFMKWKSNHSRYFKGQLKKVLLSIFTISIFIESIGEENKCRSDEYAAAEKETRPGESLMPKMTAEEGDDVYIEMNLLNSYIPHSAISNLKKSGNNVAMTLNPLVKHNLKDARVVSRKILNVMRRKPVFYFICLGDSKSSIEYCNVKLFDEDNKHTENHLVDGDSKCTESPFVCDSEFVEQMLHGDKNCIEKCFDGNKNNIENCLDGDKDCIENCLDGDKDFIENCLDGDKDFIENCLSGERDCIENCLDGDKDCCKNIDEDLKMTCSESSQEQYDETADRSHTKQVVKLTHFLTSSNRKDVFQYISADKPLTKTKPPGSNVDNHDSKLCMYPKNCVFEDDDANKLHVTTLRKPLGFNADDDGDDECNKQQAGVLDIILHQTRLVSPGDHLLSLVVYPQTNNLSIHVLMRYEILRIRTYNRHRTTHTHSISQLAQNGFYVSGQGGQVTCFNCEVIHQNFLSELNLDHTAHGENCKNERHPKNIAPFMGTQGLTAADLSLFETIYVGYHDSGKLFSQPESTNETQIYCVYTSCTTESPIEVRAIRNSGFLKVQPVDHEDIVAGSDASANFLDLTNAAYPQFANRRTRKDTFQFWDPTHSQKPDDLVDLGFFYAGYSDCARCFYCGLGLKFWRPNDEAAFHHARCRPQCKYILFVKGQDFVNQVQGNAAQENQAARANVDAVEAPEIGQLMTSDAVRQVLAEGWSQGDVRLGVTQLIKDLGKECLVYDILVDFLNNRQRESSVVEASTHGDNEEPHDAIPSSPGNAEDIRGADAGQDVVDSGVNSVTEIPGSLHPDLLLRLLEREHNYLGKRLHCLVCKNKKIGCIYLPCGHVVACQTCGDNASTCILCNKVISAMASVFLS